MYLKVRRRPPKPSRRKVQKESVVRKAHAEEEEEEVVVGVDVDGDGGDDDDVESSRNDDHFVERERT